MEVKLYDNVFTNNTAEEYGGGIFVEYGNSILNSHGGLKPPQSIPPHAETLNTYEDNAHGHGPQGRHVYFQPAEE